MAETGIRIHVATDPTALSEWAAQRFIELARRASDRDGRFTVALAGGTTPKVLYERLARPEYAGRIDWDRVRLLFGDERCVPPSDPASNYRMASEALLSRVPIAEANIARMQGEIEPKLAATEYSRAITRLYPQADPTLDRWPRLHLILLGTGPDGHTASLFPHSEALAESKALCVANPVKKVGGFRLTITRPVIAHAENVWILVSGAEKAEILARVLDGRRAPDTYPVQSVLEAKGQVVWIVDQAAAAKLPEPLRAGNV